MLLVSFPLVGLVLYKCRDTNYDIERVIHVEELEKAALHGAALPEGHHMHTDNPADNVALAEKDTVRGDAFPTA